MRTLSFAKLTALLICASAQMVGARHGLAQIPPNETVTLGRALALNRHESLCVLCHRIPGGDARLQGNLGPDLSKVGERLSVEELRDRLTNPKRYNPETIMPRTLSDEQIRQVAAFLVTLQ
jgi:sulfur oxidation c-type cytochrome SoxX